MEHKVCQRVLLIRPEKMMYTITLIGALPLQKKLPEKIMWHNNPVGGKSPICQRI
jgi:hypothetical protein